MYFDEEAVKRIGEYTEDPEEKWKRVVAWSNAYPDWEVSSLIEEGPEHALRMIMLLEGLIDELRDDALEGLDEGLYQNPEAWEEPAVAKAFKSLRYAVDCLDRPIERLRDAWADLDEALIEEREARNAQTLNERLSAMYFACSYLCEMTALDGTPMEPLETDSMDLLISWCKLHSEAVGGADARIIARDPSVEGFPGFELGIRDGKATALEGLDGGDVPEVLRRIREGGLRGLHPTKRGLCRVFSNPKKVSIDAFFRAPVEAFPEPGRPGIQPNG